jgi:hypothetical protein
MLKTVEAIVEPDGTIRVLEPLEVEVATSGDTLAARQPTTHSSRRSPYG